MVITFCGYDIKRNQDEYEAEILRILEKEVGDERVEVLVCCTDGLEQTALYCCCAYKSKHPDMKLILVPISDDIPPYLDEFFDAVLHPAFDDMTPEEAIRYRNNYIVDKCDIYITNFDDRRGPMFKLYRRAKMNEKRAYNLCDSPCFTKGISILSNPEKTITLDSVWDYDIEIESPAYFVRHIFSYLREHIGLIEEPDYKRLYDETLEFQIRMGFKDREWNESKEKKDRTTIELLADLFNGLPSNLNSKYTKAQIDDFLEYRRAIWNA